MVRRLSPVHPGRILKRILEDFNMSQNELARKLGVAPISINQIVNEKRGVTAYMALKLGKLFNQNPEMWMGIQDQHDIEVMRHKIEGELEEIEPIEYEGDDVHI